MTIFFSSDNTVVILNVLYTNWYFRSLVWIFMGIVELKINIYKCHIFDRRENVRFIFRERLYNVACDSHHPHMTKTFHVAVNHSCFCFVFKIYIYVWFFFHCLFYCGSYINFLYSKGHRQTGFVFYPRCLRVIVSL